MRKQTIAVAEMMNRTIALGVMNEVFLNREPPRD